MKPPEQTTSRSVTWVSTLIVRVVTVDDLHRHDQSAPTAVLLVAEFPSDDAARLPEYQDIISNVLYEQQMPGWVIEGKHIQSNLGASGSAAEVTAYLPTLTDVAQVIASGFAGALSKAVIERLLAARGKPSGKFIYPLDLDQARERAQSFLWMTRKKPPAPDTLIEGGKDADGNYTFTYRLTEGRGLARITVAGDGTIIQMQPVAELPSAPDAPAPGTPGTSGCPPPSTT